MAKTWNKKVLAASIVAGLLCCNPVDGKDPYALWNTYTHPDGLFHFHYLSPPWQKLTSSVPFTQRFIVDPDGIPLDELGLAGDGVEARLSMVVEVYPDMPAQAMARFDQEGWVANGAEAQSLDAFESESGIEGLRIRAEGPDRFITAIYHDLPDWGSVSMIIVGREEVDSADIRLLLESLEPAPIAARGM